MKRVHEPSIVDGSWTPPAGADFLSSASDPITLLSIESDAFPALI